MTEPRDETTALPQRKVCAGCGRSFDCALGGCWCAGVELDADALRAIKEEFTDCLCPSCLVARSAFTAP